MHRQPIRLAGFLLFLTALVSAACGGGSGRAPPAAAPAPPPANDLALDPRSLSTGPGFARVSGGQSTGRFGVPVAAGFDVDGDGFEDVAMSNMQAAPFGRAGAGQVLLLFGDGTFARSVDTAQAHPDVLVVAGAARAEAAGGEIWFDDVTGDGLGDLVIGRHNFREPQSGRIGAGAWPAVADLAAGRRPLVAQLAITDLHGAQGERSADDSGDTLLMYSAAPGDIDGDGRADPVVNEMRGNGVAADAPDVGNMLLVDATRIPKPTP